MKKLASALSILALLATMTFGFSSCLQQNQPEQPKDEEPTVVGEWKCSLITQSNSDEGPESFSFTVDGWYLTFYENGQYIENRGDNGLDKGEWYILGNKLFFHGAAEYTIKTLTKSTFVFREQYGSDWVDYTYTRIK